MSKKKFNSYKNTTKKIILWDKEKINTILKMKMSLDYCYYKTEDLLRKRFPELNEKDFEKLRIQIDDLLKKINNLISINYYEKDIISCVKKELPEINSDVIEKAVSNYFLANK